MTNSVSVKKQNPFIIATIGLLILLIASEVIFRAIGDKVSGDIKHVRTIPAIAAKLGADSNFTVLLIGNSLIAEATDEKVLAEAVSRCAGRRVSIYKVIPDGTNLTDWYFILKNYFIKNKSIPDLIITNFAWNNALTDLQQFPDHVRLAGFACNLRDIPELHSMGMGGIDTTMEFVVAHFSSIYAKRATIRNRILDKLIPHYREATQILNSGAKKPAATGKLLSITVKNSYNNLQTMIRMTREAGTRLVFVGMPLPEHEAYVIRPELESILRKEANFCDMRVVPGIIDAHYVDKMHLGAKGRQLFTSAFESPLCEQIVATVASDTSKITNK